MRTLFSFFIFISALALHADDIITTDGEIYKDVTIVKKTPAGLDISYESGLKFIPFEKMTRAMQEKYGYDPEKAMKHKKEKAAAQAKRARKQAAEFAQKKAVERIEAQVERIELKKKNAQIVFNQILKGAGLGKIYLKGKKTELVYLVGFPEGKYADGDTYKGDVYPCGTYMIENSQNSSTTVKAYAVTALDAYNYMVENDISFDVIESYKGE